MSWSCVRALLLLAGLLLPAQAVEGGGGGAGGNGGAGGLLAQPNLAAADEERLWKSLSAPQQHLIDRAVAEQAAVDASQTPALVRHLLLCYLALVGPAGYHQFFHELGTRLGELLPDDDPDDLTPQERQQAATIAPTLAAPLADLEQGDAARAKRAWRELLRVGAAARPVLLLRARQLPPDSAAALRLRFVASDLARAAEHLHLLQALDAAQAAVARLPADQRERAVWLLARELDTSIDLRGQELCYWSFALHRHGYTPPVSLEYGNGAHATSLTCAMYGGQDNQLIDLGTRERAPSTWQEALSTSGHLTGDADVAAVAGHTYAERLHEAHTDTWVLFRVVACCPDWCVLVPTDPPQR